MHEDVTYEDLRDCIAAWFESFGRWKSTLDTIRFKKEEDDTGRALFCTAAHTYSIYFTPTYLGCIASARTVRPGEDWTRGNDLPDGPFSKETFDDIMRAVVAYELVALDPPVEAKQDIPDTVPAG